jgi:hypothetical protein
MEKCEALAGFRDEFLVLHVNFAVVQRVGCGGAGRPVALGDGHEGRIDGLHGGALWWGEAKDFKRFIISTQATVIRRASKNFPCDPPPRKK